MSTIIDGQTGSQGDPLAPDESPQGQVVPPAEPYDAEINLRAIWMTGAGLVVVMVAAAALVWYLLQGFDRFDEQRDPALPPIRAAMPQEEPPLPRLQTTPEQDLRGLRQNEDEVLGRAAWVDQRQGTLRVPIDVAIEVIARRGVAPLAAAPAPAPAPATTPAAGNPQEAN